MFTDKERKLLRLALGIGAHDGEIDNAAVMLLRSLRSRGCTAEEIENVNGYGAFVIQFGKHKGKEFREIPIDYLLWLLNAKKTEPSDSKYQQSNEILVQAIEGFLNQIRQ